MILKLHNFLHRLTRRQKHPKRAVASKRMRRIKRPVLFTGAIIVGACIVAQFVFPWSRMVPFSTVDGLAVGGWQRADVAHQLDERYKAHPITLYFGSSDRLAKTLNPEDIGLATQNHERLERLTYPWYLRIVPTSLLWYGLIQSPQQPDYARNDDTLTAYMHEKLGTSCDVAPINATLKINQQKNGVEPKSAVNGGTCELGDVQQALHTVMPHLDSKTTVRVAMDEIAPKVNDDTAKTLAKTVNDRLDSGVTIKAAGKSITPKREEVVSWLQFKAPDKGIQVAVDEKKSEKYFDTQIAPKVKVAPGVTKVVTKDFQEVSRHTGPSGKRLDNTATGKRVAEFLTKKRDKLVAATKPIAPREEFTRSYSSTDKGLSALMRHYARGKKGTFGVQLIELSGKRRRASYNESKQFVAASTYKLFVAYGTLKRIESGQWKWSNQVTGGRNVAKCFDDMLVLSDNPCADTLLERYGYNALTRDIRALGLSQKSGFIGDGPKTTAADLALFMAALETKQMPISSAHRTLFLNALKRNVHRQGIPAGVTGQVADKVGFLNGLLHDSAVVYSKKGTYALVIMTDKSSWSDIADLAKRIERLR